MLVRDMVIDLIQILPDRQIQVRQVRRVVDTDTGEVVGTGAYHRFVLDPGIHEIETVKTTFDESLGKAIEQLWTPEIVSARKQFITAQEAIQEARMAGNVNSPLDLPPQTPTP